MNTHPANEEPPIFLSYSREDEVFCNKLVTDLEQAGIDIWMDQRRIKPGQRWDDEIQKAIKQTKIMMVVLSPASCESENVGDEVNYALDQDDVIVPVLLKECDIFFRLSRVQYIDFTSDCDAAFVELVARLTGENFDLPEVPFWKRLRGLLLARRKLIFSIAFSVFALIFAAEWVRQIMVTPDVPLLQLGDNRTLIDADDNNTESVTLDPGPTLSNGTPIKSYHWKLDGRTLTDTRAAQLNLTLGRHKVLLTVIDQDGEQHEDRLSLNVLTQTQAEERGSLLDIARQNIQLAEKKFEPVLLTEGVSSAYVALQLALKIDPFNEEAKKQLRRIADIYTIEAQKNIEQNDNNTAAALIGKGLQLDPEHPELVKLRKALPAGINTDE